jgi:PTH1 family peptidyl-tRNA hydrolase
VKLVVGLGNPGRRYAATRHNVGFRVVERFAARHAIPLDQERFLGRYGRGRVLGLDVGVLAPETFMNLSGDAVAAALRRLPVEDPARDLVVVLDDVDLPFGRLRIRPSGGAGGHKGLADIIEKLGRRDFARVRFGVGRPSLPMDTADFVLQRFAPEEEAALGPRVEEAVQALETLLTEGPAEAMNRFNRAAAARDVDTLSD